LETVVTSATMDVAASVSVAAVASTQATGFTGNPVTHARHVTIGICRWSLTPA
jgi:hypothetical protein